MAMSEIGALRVRLAMDVGRFIQNSKRARRASGSMAKSIGKGLAGLAATAGAAAGIIAGASARVADSMDMLNKKAKTAGISAEFYQTLKFAAIEAGVAQGKLDKAMETLLKRVGEARLGLGPLASKLKEYDEELFKAIKNTRSQEEAMRLLAEATQRESDAANRGALTSAAFSKANMQMLRIMEQGAEVFDKTTKKARKFNAIIGQDVLDNMSEMNNRMGVATEQISQNWSAMVAQMMKENVSLQESLAETMKDIREFFFSLREIQSLPREDAKRMLGETEQEIERVEKRLARLRSGGAQGPAAQMGAAETINNLERDLNELLERRAKLEGRVVSLTKSRFDIAREMREEEKAAQEEGGTGPGGFDTETVDTATQFNDQVNRGLRLMETARTPMQAYRDDIAAINAAQAKGLGNTKKWQDAQHRAALMVASDYAGLAGNVAGSLGQIFGESKGVAIAQAVINTAQAVTRTLAEYGGTPWGWANAAAAAAAGAAEIATIKRTTKSGSGGGSTSQASGGGAAAGAQGAGQAGVQQGVNITLQGQSFGRDQVRGLIEQINEQVADGAQLNVSFA